MNPASTSETRALHFRDPRPPQAILAELERDHMMLLAPAMRDARLVLAGGSRINGAPYSLELSFEAALDDTNCYALSIEISWQNQTAAAQDYHRKVAPSWLALWLSRYQPSTQIAYAVPDARYDELVRQALAAEAQLTDTTAIQQAILDGLHAGGQYVTSHKEGGTRITWQVDRFVRLDHGDRESRQIYASEADFLARLRQFFDWQVSRSTYPDTIDELSAWKLILRLLAPAKSKSSESP